MITSVRRVIHENHVSINIYFRIHTDVRTSVTAFYYFEYLECVMDNDIFL